MNRRAIRYALSLLCMTATLGADAAAGPARLVADDAPDDLAALPLEQLMQVQMVTSASRFEQSTSDAPSAVVVLTAQDIREYGWRTLADALASVPGLYVTQDRNYSYLGARGFLRPGDYSSRFLLLIDGVRTNDSVYDQATVGTEALLDMDLVARIEYVPGPGAAVYGSNALFGVINVITKTGSTIGGTRGSVGVGSDGERRARATFGWHAQSGEDLLLSASTMRRRGRDLYFAEFDTPAQNNGVAHDLDGDRAHSFFAKASGHGLVFSAGYVDRIKSVPTGSFGAVFNTPNTTRDGQAFANLGYSHALADGVLLDASVYWGRADYLGLGYYPDDDGNARQNVDGDHASWHGANVHATVTALAGHKLVAGVEMQRNRRRDQFSFDETPYESMLDDHRADTRWGAYADDEVQLRPGLLFNAGLRYDHDSVIGRKVSPRAALIARPTARDTVKLIYGTSYRSPNAYELYYEQPGEGGMRANQQLRPEVIRTRELVWERMLDAYGKVTASVFHNGMDNLITQQLGEDDGLLMFRNTNRASAKGIELAGERVFGSGARLRASYTAQYAHDDEGEWLVSSPRRLAKLAATVPLSWLNARLGDEILCSSARRTEHALAPGYCVTNVTLSSVHAWHGLGWSASIYNATDRRYADPAGPAFVQEALARPGRSFALRVDSEFR